MTNFEAAGDISNWPPNVPGKPTQAAVFGLLHPRRGRVCEILWTGKFPELDAAMYWAAKKEMQAVRKDKWMVASRVLWQHELTPEQAVEAAHRQMRPQMDRVLGQLESGEAPDVGQGPMQPVDPRKVQGHYVEIEDAEGNTILPGTFVPNVPDDQSERDDEGDDDGPPNLLDLINPVDPGDPFDR